MRECKVKQRERRGGGGRAGGVCFVVPTMVPLVGVSSNSQCVPQDIPNNATLLSYMLWPKLNFHVQYINYKGGGQRKAPLCSYWEFPMFQEKRSDVPIKVAPSKKCWAHPSTC
jgi:hypothetical protein